MPIFNNIIDSQQLKKAQNNIRALNHPLRQKILNFISNEEPIMVKKIYNTLEIEQSVCSQHLSILREAGFVTKNREGRKIYYSIDYDRIHNFRDQLQKLNESSP